MNKRGFSVFEMWIVIILVGILAVTVSLVFISGFRSFWVGFSRSCVVAQASYAIEKMEKELREAKAIAEYQNLDDNVKFTVGSSSYCYYLYNSLDPWPNPPFSELGYQLKRAALVGGSFSYGDGITLIDGVLAPPTSDISVQTNLVNFDLSVKRINETIRYTFKVRPRNM